MGSEMCIRDRDIMSVVHSVNIMIMILLVAVSIVIYYILTYDEFYPNDSSHSHDDHSSHGGSDNGG